MAADLAATKADVAEGEAQVLLHMPPKLLQRVELWDGAVRG